ncbi:MAG: hypothetical protein J6C08_00185 [Campylobacter sp.]|uniref:DUF3883 domain-containing protein n=1 Tax=Campylobacter sp. TaxID=205 RepID=UPI001B0B710E|nr:DUF3883 domain-containing protein [Campylobacter sp.]MBO5062889.1 hypothetical protein [Campylobacter sp.]MBO5062918.1 hypothetical protein [Campylobacter sp.]
MLSNFKRDLEAARDAEFLVLQLLMGATDAYDFFWVGDNREYFNKGDIKAIDKSTGREIYIEVKDDSRIADTDNVLCEEEVDYFDYTARGNIHNDYDVYVVVSKQERKIYVLDGKVLKANYKLGQYKYIQHRQQASNVYLLPLGILKRKGGLLATISYDLESRRASIAA